MTVVKRRFFVQEAWGDAWHCETEDDCELMLCGRRVSVDAPFSKVQSRWGPRKCPDCWIILEGIKAVGNRVDAGAGPGDVADRAGPGIERRDDGEA